MASSSSSSMLNPGKYDVFISFRGEDTRKTFIDHLYSALHQNGIVTFEVDERLERGKSIGPELLKAIGESSTAIVVFSKNYASSSWCLDELVEILKHQKAREQIVYPVFYHVEPTDVRKQKGSFGEGFAQHKGKPRTDAWREALEEAANLSGWDTRNIANGHEAECIKTIVREIQGTLYHKYSVLEEKLIGIISRVEKVKSILRMGSGDVRMIGIWGMGGAGKTTIAGTLFREVSNQFDTARFVKNVREVAANHGLHVVQKELLLSMGKSLEIQNVSDGIQRIRKMLCRQKVLVVLDDVDQISQLDALVGDCNWFGEGSRIIITTRDERLLLAHGIKDIYNVDLLNEEEALQLFSQYAFRMSGPVKAYEQHSRLVVHYAAGHPLTLKVLGNSLRGRDMTKWITTLDRLKEIPKRETLETLKVSYDGLEDIEKEIFLDIACFFKGWHRLEVYKILDCCGFDTEKWVNDLIQKSLIYISNERFEMHDMIQEMGQHIVRGKHPQEPRKHSRLWNPQEVLDVLAENVETEEIQAIVVQVLNNAEFVNFTSAFRNMVNLRLLYLDTQGMSFLGPECLPGSLQYLNWKNYNSSSLPANFGSGKLVGLQMNYSSIVELWKGVKYLHNLKFVDLVKSKKLSKTPNFTGVPNLERLLLSGCSSLVKVHRSLGILEKLTILDFSHCYSLRSFPSSIMMKSLKILNLNYCLNFKKFPEIQGKMDGLTDVYLEQTAIEELPSSIANLPNLTVLTLLGCADLVRLPHSICNLQNLRSLDVRRCIKLSTLPENLGNIGCLEHLLVSTVTQLPSSIIHLKNLKTFSAIEPPSSIFHQKGVSGWISAVTSLFFKKKDYKHRKFPQDLYQVLPAVSSLTSLKELGLCNLSDGMILPVDIGTLSSLEYLVLCDNQFASLPFSISQLSVLRRLDLSNCQRLQALPELPSSLALLFANNCKSLDDITGLKTAQGRLRQVSFLGCRRLEDQLSDTLTLEALQTTLQGYSSAKHQSTILLPGSKIPNWFLPQITGCGQIVLQLPSDWHNQITGVALCVVADFMGLTRPLRLTLSSGNIASVSNGASYRHDRLQTWMEYISFDLLQRSYDGIVRPDWITRTPGLVLTISTESIGVKTCGARFVYRDYNVQQITTAETNLTSMENQDPALKSHTRLPKCFRETGYDAITYSLYSGTRYIPEANPGFDRLSWTEKHEHYRSGRASLMVGMRILD